jgi:hypothetical protein
MGDSNVPHPPMICPAKEHLSPGQLTSEEGIALLLLRLLGVYFMAKAFIAGWAAASAISVAIRRFPSSMWTWEIPMWLSTPIGCLLIGIYFVVGGRWVFNRLLTPIRRRQSDDRFRITAP